MTSALRSRLAVLLLLSLITGTASVLRLAGSGAGLRHRPPADERDFVENVGRMLEHGDLDHRYYQYPGLVFYLLYPVLAAQPRPFTGEAYQAVRSLAAVFSVLSVVLSFVLARRLGGPVAGLAAAGLMAVAPIEVMSVHPLKPDVVLETFCLLALVVFEHLRTQPRGDVRAGVAIGLATAVKFTGVLLVPVYLVRRLASVGSRRLWSSVAVAALAALVSFALASPYTFLHWREALAGAVTQVSYHYPDPAGSDTGHRVLDGYGERWLLYASILVSRGIGVIGAGLALTGVWLDRRGWRRWIHLLVLPLVVISVFASSPVKHDRFLLAGLGSAAVLVGLGVSRVAARAPALALLAGLIAPLPLFVESVRYVTQHTRPGTRDTTLDFLESHGHDGERVASAVDDLGFDRGRWEVVALTGSVERDRLLVRHADWLVLVAENSWLAEERGWSPAHTAEPSSIWSGPLINVFRVPADDRVRYHPLPLGAATLTSSQASDRLERLRDGVRRTSWRTPGAQRPGDWIEVAFPEPVWLARVELDPGTRFGRYARGLELLVSQDGQRFVEAVCIDERPPMREQLRAPRRPSQILLLLEPRPVRVLRIVQTGRASQPWGIAELRMYSDHGSSTSPHEAASE